MSLARRSRIERKTPLPRAGWVRKSPGAHRKPRAVRDTGFSPAVKAQIRERAQGRCEAGGEWVGSGGEIQHRRARGRGGSRDPVTSSAANGGLLCRPCHAACEAREEHLHAAGWWIWSWQDPRAEPVMLHDEGGGMTVWLGADGAYWLSPPERAA